VVLCLQSPDLVWRQADNSEWRQVGEVTSCVVSSVLRSMESKVAASKPKVRPETSRAS
jgi:hypothetical protein